ncbi:MAG: leucyl/phenylalanyl-tRNA--protein transferase [Chitinophagaceae bacterium]|nr:MAG: leucyl/phenylalanyl-tRNA--protein transferase [Chitinophagaceae bacterium]
MPIFALDENLYFPPTHLAEPDGLLAMGGDLSTERLLLAYKNGIFPWYNEPPILWWSPNPRFVLFPDELKISKSLQSLIKKNSFKFTINTACKQVITSCKNIERKDQDGTWINHEIVDAYYSLHEKGSVYSAEVWQNNQLVGGLYGVLLGKIFFGESMFSHVSNASKVAFVQFVKYLKEEKEIELIDCQIYSEYLESFGARMIPLPEFQRYLYNFI